MEQRGLVLPLVVICYRQEALLNEMALDGHRLEATIDDHFRPGDEATCLV